MPLSAAAKLDASVQEFRAALAINEVDDPFRSRGTSRASAGSVGAPPRYLKHQRGSPFSSAAIIEVLVELAEIEHAWSLAPDFGAAANRWADLAERRAGDHPGDAVEWELVAAKIEIDHKSRKNYRRRCDTFKPRKLSRQSMTTSKTARCRGASMQESKRLRGNTATSERCLKNS